MKSNTAQEIVVAMVCAMLRLPEVKRRTGLSRTEIYRRCAAGTFPRPVKIGKHASAWPEPEVSQWVANLIAERDARTAT